MHSAAASLAGRSITAVAHLAGSLLLTVLGMATVRFFTP